MSELSQDDHVIKQSSTRHLIKLDVGKSIVVSLINFLKNFVFSNACCPLRADLCMQSVQRDSFLEETREEAQ